MIVPVVRGRYRAWKRFSVVGPVVLLRIMVSGTSWRRECWKLRSLRWIRCGVVGRLF